MKLLAIGGMEVAYSDAYMHACSEELAKLFTKLMYTHHCYTICIVSTFN